MDNEETFDFNDFMKFANMDNLFDGFFDDMQSVYLYYSFRNFLKLMVKKDIIKKIKKINQMIGRMKTV